MLELVESTEVPWSLLKTLSSEDIKHMPYFRWDEFYVADEKLVSIDGRQQDIRQPFCLPSHKLGWEAPFPSDMPKRDAMVFVEFLEKCGCPPTSENEALSGNLADFWFDASSETAWAYYRLRISRADSLSGSVAMLKATVYQPAQEFDSAAIRNLTFLDFTLSSIASICGAHTLS